MAPTPSGKQWRLPAPFESRIGAALAHLAGLMSAGGQIFHISANRSNIGDWLSAMGIDITLAPLRIHPLYCDRRFVKRTMARLRYSEENDLIVIGGGGLLHGYFAPFWEALSQVSLRVPYVVWGVGICEKQLGDSQSLSRVLADVLQGAEMVVVRDPRSSEYLSTLSVESRIVPCPSAVLFDHTWPEGRGMLHVKHRKLLPRDTLDAISDILSNYATATGREYREVDNIVRAGSRHDLIGVLDCYARSDIIVSSRLHGCLIGAAMGKRVLAVSADRKLDAFMETVALEDQVIEETDIGNLEDLLYADSISAPARPYASWARNLNENVADDVWELAWPHLTQ